MFKNRKTLKIVKKYKNLSLTFEKELLLKLSDHGIENYPNEFGGFLIGSYSKDMKTLFINATLLPKKYNGFPTLFERSTEGIIIELEVAFNSKGIFYIGEWHTHPSGSSLFSKTDLNSMIEIAECETVKIKNPILLIISINHDKLLDYTFYFYNNQNLFPYE